MAIQEHLEILRNGVHAWNTWRETEHVRPDLSHADLSEMELSGIRLDSAILNYTKFNGTDLSSAFIIYADMVYAELEKANLQNAVLQSSRLLFANLRGANMRSSDLMAANLALADLTGADISGSKVFAISPWAATLDNVRQSGLVITQDTEPQITVDNLAVAQFIYLLLNNATIRAALDTITSKVVLILGRFSTGRKEVLDALREELRRQNYSPVLFDFDRPASRDLTETISTLAHLARFIVADITDPRSIPQELTRIIPFLPSVPIQPLLQSSSREYGMFEHFRHYPWVLPICYYDDPQEIVANVHAAIIQPAENCFRILHGRTLG